MPSVEVEITNFLVTTFVMPLAVNAPENILFPVKVWLVVKCAVSESKYALATAVPFHTPVATVPRTVIAVLEPTSRATGSVVPSPIKISPSPKTAVAVIASVPLPNNIPPSVNVLAPVPPLATDKSVPKVRAPPTSKSSATCTSSFPAVNESLTVIGTTYAFTC